MEKPILPPASQGCLAAEQEVCFETHRLPAINLVDGSLCHDVADAQVTGMAQTGISLARPNATLK
jgi:hypothetical protein